MTDNMIIPVEIVDVNPHAKINFNGKAGHYTGTVIKYTTLKSGKSMEERVSDKTLSIKTELADKIKGLAAGDKVTLIKEKQGNFLNLVDIQEVREKRTHSATVSKTETTDNFSQRAARGQALNLAVALAVSKGKGDDDAFILSQVDRFLALGEKVQKGDSSDDII